MVNRSDDGLRSFPQALYTPRVVKRSRREALITACGRITAPPQWSVGKDLAEAGDDMSLQDGEQRALDAIEYQLLFEDPQLWDCFSALGSLTPPIKPVNGWWRTAPVRKEARLRKDARRGLRRCTDNQVLAIVIELVLVIIAVVLVVMFILGTARPFQDRLRLAGLRRAAGCAGETCAANLRKTGRSSGMT
jgi:Protein of unknown function (DUF3040)